MLESLFLVLSISMDAFFTGFAYGANKIKIPLLSGIIMTVISTLFLTLSLSLGTLIKNVLSSEIAPYLCFTLLFALGLIKLFEGVTRNFLDKKASSPEHIEFTLFDFKLVLKVCADVTRADMDHSKTLSAKEALYLGVALSLDSLAVGLGAGLATVNFFQIIFLSLIINALMLFMGSTFGKKLSEKINKNFSWMSGIILIILAITKLA